MKKQFAYAAMFSEETFDDMVGMDNQKFWTVLAIFRDPLEAARWRQEKYLGSLDKTKIKRVSIIIEE